MSFNNTMIAIYIVLATIGTAEFLSKSIAKSFEDAQNNLVKALKETSISRMISVIVEKIRIETSSEYVLPFFLATLIALATFSSLSLGGLHQNIYRMSSFLEKLYMR